MSRFNRNIVKLSETKLSRIEELNNKWNLTGEMVGIGGEGKSQKC